MSFIFHADYNEMPWEKEVKSYVNESCRGFSSNFFGETKGIMNDLLGEIFWMAKLWGFFGDDFY